MFCQANATLAHCWTTKLVCTFAGNAEMVKYSLSWFARWVGGTCIANGMAALPTTWPNCVPIVALCSGRSQSCGSRLSSKAHKVGGRLVAAVWPCTPCPHNVHPLCPLCRCWEGVCKACAMSRQCPTQMCHHVLCWPAPTEFQVLASLAGFATATHAGDMDGCHWENALTIQCPFVEPQTIVGAIQQHFGKQNICLSVSPACPWPTQPQTCWCTFAATKCPYQGGTRTWQPG